MTSPDGRYIASIFETTCYDTTGYTPHAHLRRAGEKRADRGNLLTGAPTDTFRATWTSRDNLLIEYQTYQDYIHPPTTNIAGVTVSFRKLPRPR